MFTVPLVCESGGDQVKSLYVSPVPASCREWPADVALSSITPISMLIKPAALPSTAVNEPS